MSNTAMTVPVSLDGIWADLDRQGYALTCDHELGPGEGSRERFRDSYFNSRWLRREESERPADRERARDVIGYQWTDGRLQVCEHDTITITDRDGIPGARDHSRVMLLGDPHAEQLIRLLISLVPPPRRRPSGTFGVNLLRTFTNVVTAPHHDHEEFIITYVIDRVGDGAETYLYRPGDVPANGEPTAKPVLRHQLSPGEIVIFEDRLFKHGATPLTPPPCGQARRDTLVCTIDHQSTYAAMS
jgi:hypothetical protein